MINTQIIHEDWFDFSLNLQQVKIDIEGSEYPVLKQMFCRGLMNRIDILAIEWHWDVYFTLESERLIIGKKKECLEWMLSDLADIKMVNWNRRL